MPNPTLAEIRTKVRRLTRNPSTAQLSDAQIDEYVNTFIAYDIPENLRLFTLRTTLTFYTEPNVDTYETNAIAGDALNNFENAYITVHEPVYIAGRQSLFTQSRDQFYAYYPIIRSIRQEATGTGAQTNFTGTLTSVPVLRNNVTFTSINVAEAGLEVHDDGAGNLVGDIGVGVNTINYVTGVYDFTYSSAPKVGQDIDSQTVPFVAGLPRAILYFQNKFIVRPVPDQPYPINIEAYYRPSDLLAAGSEPVLEQWYEYISYGAAIKVFQDKMDIDSVNLVMPEFNRQERKVLRRTLVQQSNERVATIYTEASGFGPGSGWNNRG